MSSTLGLVVVEAGGSRGGGGGVVPRRDFRLFHLLPQLSSRYLPSTHISPLRLLSPPCFRPSSSAAPPSPNSGLPLRSHRRDQRATSHPRLVGVYIITTWSERIEQQGPHPRRLIVLPFGCVAKKKKKKASLLVSPRQLSRANKRSTFDNTPRSPANTLEKTTRTNEPKTHSPRKFFYQSGIIEEEKGRIAGHT